MESKALDGRADEYRRQMRAEEREMGMLDREDVLVR